MLKFAYGDKFAAFLYDAIMVYALALNESLSSGVNFRDGATVALRFRGKSFKGTRQDRMTQWSLQSATVLGR